ncbi:MAG: phage portal protein [Clostridiales bacterium]|nr:MAG: phage portal protein [Clostridiales bacterium]
MFFTETGNETKRLNALIEAGAKELMADDEALADRVREWAFDPRRIQMLDGARYYRGDNDILGRKRLVIGEDGELVEDKSLTNNRIAHSFFRKLVDQKSQYLFGRPFSVSTDDGAYGDILNGIFDQRLRRKIQNLCKEAVVKGIAWLQPYIDHEGIHFQKIPAEEVIPLWEDSEHTVLEAAVRVYTSEGYEGRRKKTFTHVEYWDSDGVRYYLMENGKLSPDPMRADSCHMTIGGKGYNFKKVPFIPFKYNEEEISLIRYVKPLIDDYDLLKSDDSNAIMDTPNSILVVKNYDGQGLGEFRKNLSQYKAVKVTDDGGLDIKSTGLSTDMVEKHLKLDRKDLYEAGRGVDTQSEDLKTASGVALKFLYADLDLDCNGIESEFMGGLSEMVSFVNLWLQLSGQGDFGDKSVRFVLNRDIIINEEQAIDDCMKSEGMLSRQTVLENHPWVTDVEEELRRCGEGKE